MSTMTKPKGKAMTDEPEGRVIGKDSEPTNTEETFEAAVIRMIQDLDRRVGQLVDDLIGTDKAVNYELAEKIKRLEGQTQFETSEDDAHFRQLEKMVEYLKLRQDVWENTWSQTVTRSFTKIQDRLWLKDRPRT